MDYARIILSIIGCQSIEHNASIVGWYFRVIILTFELSLYDDSIIIGRTSN